MAEPPAESPSTRNSSHLAGSVSWQSASFPGRPAESSAPFRLASSFALRAASLALAASRAFSTIFLATDGVSSKKVVSFSYTRESTIPFTSLFPSRCFVCPSNWGSGTLTEITAVSPSRRSSPERFSFTPLSRFPFWAYWFTARVSAERKPMRWVPPSYVLMLFAKAKTVSW